MKPLLYILLIAAIAVVYTACKDDKDIIPQTHGRVMVFNSVPANAGYPAFNVFLDSTQIANHLVTGDTSVFSVFRAQLYTVGIINASTNATVSAGELTIRNNHSFSFYLVYDTLPAENQPNITALATDDDLTPPVEQNSKVRVIDLSSTIDGATTLRQPMTVMMDADSVLLYNGMVFPQVGDFRTIQPGTHKFYFRLLSDSAYMRRDSITLKMDSTHIYTIYTSGSLLRADQFKVFSYRHWK
ncbi:protein of unknown function [Chitinophaga costaii]|uniref:DUF4397 domain-containing protein n=1 Tax=Chitinophaga costaii TaxID=1335309 RepID=A0A1C3ZNC5_9BACT|nr:DUF4397 domain-containing protein [Chitinophaga costaii]PUZ30444.1 DUF4397 domain-containing protein [Chitinophaga costaii]SCB83833.1 protein of unknown function [Chitinophaga costaii]